MIKLSEDLPFILSADTGRFLALGDRREEGGQQVQRFRKELIRVGQYVHPADGMPFQVTSKTLDHWVATFSRMQTNGIKVPVPVGHWDPVPPDKNRGWLVDVFREGDSLFGKIDLVGEDAIALAGRADVSLYCPADLSDSKENVYKRPIEHVALCTDPVIPGLGQFMPIAASKGGLSIEVPVLKLQMEGSKMDLAKIQESLGEYLNGQELTEEAAEALIVMAIENMKQRIADLSGEPKEEAPPAEAAEPPAPDEELVSLSAENRQMKLAKLVEEHNISPAVRKALEKEFIGENNVALSLSLQHGTADRFDKVLAILKENNIVALGEKTGGQTVKLTRSIETTEEDAKQAQEIADEMDRDMGLSIPV
jgi:hypothetical protein